MRLQRHRYIIAACGAVVALALILFPDWNAVSAQGLTMGLGHAWILEAFFIRAEKEIPCE